MKLSRPDIKKFRDISRKNGKWIALIFLSVPTLFGLSYFLVPDSYKATIKVEFHSSFASSEEIQDPKITLKDSFHNERYFTKEEAAYFDQALKNDPRAGIFMVINGNNPIEITLADKKYSRIDSIVKKLSSVFETRLGYCTYPEFMAEKQDIERKVQDITLAKKQAEDSYLAMDEDKALHQKERFAARISELETQITNKTQQLAIIESRASDKSTKDLSKNSLFKSKSRELTSEIEELKAQREDLTKNSAIVVGDLDKIERVKTTILDLEKQLDSLTKKLNSLTASESQDKTGYIKMPYQWQAKLLEPVLPPVKVLTGSNFNKRFIAGILLAALIVLLLFAYNLIFDPLITSIEELEEVSGQPVIGAIYEMKKK